MIEQVQILNFKSIKALSLPLKRLNIFIGVNGVGKSNFISFFELTKALYEQRLSTYTLEKGGIDSLLYNGRKCSDSIKGFIDFDNTNAFSFSIKPTQSSQGFVEYTRDYFNAKGDKKKQYNSWSIANCDDGVEESELKDNDSYRAKYLQGYLSGFTIYHFHDTSGSAAMRRECDINDNNTLRHDASNLAAYLYRLKTTDVAAFRRIEAVVSSIAPYFKRFDLRPSALDASKINLEWEEVNSDMYLNGFSFSDGTIRFIALTTLLLQTKLPEVIIIDEPELGLHPAAITKLAAMIKRASRSSQIIVSTQSTNFVDMFDAEDIVVVDRDDKQSVFNRLSEEKLAEWIKDYSLSELWEMNVFGG